MDALHNNVFRNARSLSQSREPETSVFVLIADEWNRNTRQFVSKATRPKLPSGLLALGHGERDVELFVFVNVVFLMELKEDAPMMKIAFVAAAALAVLTTAPLTIPVKAQGVDVQLWRDRDDSYRHLRDSDVTVGIGPGGVTVGPRRNCRMVTTTVERDDGRIITRKERRCD